MTDGQNLLRAIIAHPKETTPRLVYADWLDENGKPERAEFIRVQCKLAVVARDAPEWDALQDRERELLRLYGPEWSPVTLGPGVYGATFRRGFVEVVSATAHAFATRRGRWDMLTPLRGARLSSVAGRADRVAAHLRGIDELIIEDPRFDDDDLAALSGSPYLGGLRDFSVVGHPTRGTLVSAQGACVLAYAPFLPQLERLYICAHPGLDSLPLGVLAGGRLDRLREFGLEHTSADDRGATALAAADWPAVERISIRRSRVGNDGLVALATSERLPALNHLQLRQGRITGDALTAVARSARLSRWRHISLFGNPLGSVDVGAVADLLAAHPNLVLDLRTCDLPYRLQEQLLRRFGRRVTVDDSATQACYARALCVTRTGFPA